MTRSSAVRLWWAAPGALVAGSAIGAAIVIGPTLGEQVAVPRQLDVPTASPAGAATPASPTGNHHKPARSHPTPTPSQTPLGRSPSPRVVQPHHPIVTASAEDDSGPDSGVQHEGGDG